MKRLAIAAVLPHLGVFGGVRRYLSLGNEWVRMGHRVVLFTPAGAPPEWLPFAGEVRAWDALPAAGEFDLAFTPQPALLERLRILPARRRVWYCVLAGERGEAEALCDPRVDLMANSSALRARLARRAGRPVLDGVGGIDPALFRPDPSRRGPGLRVAAYGRRSRARKGTDLVVEAVRRVRRLWPALELVLFDHLGEGNERDPRAGFAPGFPVRWILNPTATELAALYASADVFVSAERRAGWCNTAIEALASGCALVTTPSGAEDFARHESTALVVRWRHPWFLARTLRRVLDDGALRDRLQAAGPAAAAAFAWPVLARRILEQLAPDGA